MAQRIAQDDRQDDGGLFDWGSLDVREEQAVDLKPATYIFGNRICRIFQQRVPDVKDPEATGVKVWPAAEALAQHFQNNPKESVEGRTVLELGSGMGLVGLAALALGASRVLLTDVREVLPGLRKTIKMNDWCRQREQKGTLEIDELDWRDVACGRKAPPGQFDLICWADCIYWPELFEPLCGALRRLAGRQTSVLFAAADRGRLRAFLEVLRRDFVAFELWCSRSTPQGGHEHDLWIFRAQLR